MKDLLDILRKQKRPEFAGPFIYLSCQLLPDKYKTTFEIRLHGKRLVAEA